MQSKVFMESPSGDVKEIEVSDPNRDLIPLMVGGWHQVQVQEPVTQRPVSPQAPPHQQAEEEK
jgi:hypothetical protein